MHVDILRPKNAPAIRFRFGRLRSFLSDGVWVSCDQKKVILQGYKNYINNSDYFPREIIIIARCIQQIVTCYDIFSSHNHIRVGQVFTSAVAVVFHKMALAFVPAAVSHAQSPYHTAPLYAPVLIFLPLNC